MPVRHEELRAREDEAAALPRLGGDRDPGGVPAGALLEEGEGGPGLPGGDARQPRRLLCLRARVEHREPAEEHGREERAGHDGAPHLLEDHREVDESQADATVRLGVDQAEPAELGELAPELVGRAGGVVHHPPDESGGTLLLEEAPRRLAQQLLFLAEPEVHQSTWGGAAPLRLTAFKTGPRRRDDWFTFG